MLRKWEQYVRGQCVDEDPIRVNANVNSHRLAYLHRVHVYNGVEEEDEPEPMFVGNKEILVTR